MYVEQIIAGYILLEKMGQIQLQLHEKPELKIVAEKPIYQTPPFLQEGVNYYTYTSVDECLQKVAFLFEHPAAMLEMMQINERYYQEHLRPDRLVRDTLDFALR